ncbi:uncharacterized protein mpp4b isoform X3 [Synchiropus splendidus]|uniref:uncharacterized protein mpp4b isoform X3 n=1 Tax=Synchiropus splendidus TaxID=270530 RepID=UPI00237DDFDD|nr:uncharacterized protein mpp4b isoform X3 [Synchiropus splendidus]
MRQAVEAQVLSPHFELGEHGLHQILTDVVEDVKQSINQDIDGAEILHGLLNAPWLQSLLKIFECLQKYRRDSPAPVLEYASGLSLQLLIEIKSLPGCSEDAKELYRLLRQPHLQALLSAHDTVAQKDYDPVLPPVPDDVPDDEEATRIVCLVKNKQPLRGGGAASPLFKNARKGIRSHWDTLRHLTQQRLQRSAAFGAHAATSKTLGLPPPPPPCDIRRGSLPLSGQLHRSAARPAAWPGRRCEPVRGPLKQCQDCYTNLLMGPSLNHSAPSVCTTVIIEDCTEQYDSDDESIASSRPSPSRPRRWSPSVPVPYYSNVDEYFQPGFSAKVRSQVSRTAPPSPMRTRHILQVPPVELAKQESLDELRSTVQLAASSMESSTKDIKLLGEKMAAATERMSETVQDNSQALILLSQVVERLQTVLASSRSDSPGSAGEQDGTPKIQRRLQHPASPPSSTSSSLSSCLDAPSTSQGTSCVSCHGSPQTPTRWKTLTSPQRSSEASKPLTNGVNYSPTAKGSRSNQRKKKKKHKKTR